MPDLQDALSHHWPPFRASLRASVDESAWELWLSPLRPRSLDGATLVVEAPDQIRAWVRDRYGRLLDACATACLGRPVAVVVSTEAERPADSDQAPPEVSSASRRGSGAANPRLTFDQFVIGDSNRLAHAAALAVAEMPGLAYNPLFICGAPGLGKTHLLQSIANYAQAHGENVSVRMTSAETFTNGFLGALHGSGNLEAFKAAHRSVDILLVDDVQFLQSKARTEEEFFHLFNDLHANGSQIVLSSDRPPRDMGALEDRLRERFEAGLVCEVKSPDRETRCTILRKRVLQDRIELKCDDSLEVIEVIADRVTENIRSLEGALIRVVAFASLTGRRLDGALAHEVLEDLYPKPTEDRTLSAHSIQEAVSRHFGVPLDAMLSTSRVATVAWARQVAMHLVRDLTDSSLPSIAAAFGGRSHTTVMHACRRVAERLAIDPSAAADVDKLARELRGASS